MYIKVQSFFHSQREGEKALLLSGKNSKRNGFHGSKSKMQTAVIRDLRKQNATLLEKNASLQAQEEGELLHKRLNKAARKSNLLQTPELR